MTRRKSLKTVVKDLDGGKIAAMAAGVWSGLAGHFPLVERIDTGMAGELLLVRTPARGWALVEAPDPDERVVRPLDNEKEARALIDDRMKAYERMWDG